jgi:hypothetical protein
MLKKPLYEGNKRTIKKKEKERLVCREIMTHDIHNVI